MVGGKTNFRPSSNKHDWLGSGIYFWEQNPRRAQDWAKFMAEHPRFRSRVKTPFAIGAVIELGNCLDLTESESLEIVKTAYDELAEDFDVVGIPLPKNQPGNSADDDLVKRYLDCAVINFLHDLRERRDLEPFDTVRGAFFEGEELYPGAGIRKKTHIQVCVRNPAKIRGVFHIPNA